ncbi:MAG TPA: tRNA uracil 4-sulfurtransferase ThiI [Methanothrix sp.]|nr:tRNA uracil 4-sulfurtransferase ThiI [Methanothrix sp.]
MISQDVVLVRYGEITLKDRWTRQKWERILAGNIAFSLDRAAVAHKMERGEGRIFVHTSDPRACQIAAMVFGTVSASPAQTVASDLQQISLAAVELAGRAGLSGLAGTESRKSFAIRPRRSGVSFTSEQIGRAVGQAVQSSSGASVDLERPDLEIYIEARRDRTFIFTDVVKGVGGLPLGSQGRMLALISGGIDSPVAAWMMMKRGCPVTLLHFDSRPYADAISQSMRCAEALARWTSGRKIDFITVPISRAVEKISSHYPRATCVLCRRLMYRIASQVMLDQGCLGIVTGYSMGQVASQTAENILAEQSGICAPVYHPLIALDKSEITGLARRIGTYGISEETKPCTAVPRRPVTRAGREEINRAEELLGLVEMAGALAKEMTVSRIG